MLSDLWSWMFVVVNEWRVRLDLRVARAEVCLLLKIGEVRDSGQSVSGPSLAGCHVLGLLDSAVFLCAVCVILGCILPLDNTRRGSCVSLADGSCRFGTSPRSIDRSSDDGSYLVQLPNDDWRSANVCLAGLDEGFWGSSVVRSCAPRGVRLSLPALSFLDCGLGIWAVRNFGKDLLLPGFVKDAHL